MKKARDTKSPLAQDDAQQAIADFRTDFENQYDPYRVTDSIVQRAMGLAEKHKLRGYDAVQLAAALIISEECAKLGIPATGIPPLVLVASDVELLNAARTEGLVVDDPRNHP